MRSRVKFASILLASTAALIAANLAWGATGDLTYRGCLTGETLSGPGVGGSGACAEIPDASLVGADSGLDLVSSLVLRGRSFYATSEEDDAVARFRRDATTGRLTFKDCVTGETESGPGASGACDAIPKARSFGVDSGIDGPTSIALSSDGKSLYAVSSNDDAVASFRRDRTTGALTYRGCITGETESGPGAGNSKACDAIPKAAATGKNSGLDFLQALAVSEDGKSVYAVSTEDDAVSRFARDTGTGALNYRGCITGERQTGPAGRGACDAIPKAQPVGEDSGLNRISSAVVSSDGRSLYVGSEGDDGVARFARSSSGALTYRGCITGEKESGPGAGNTNACDAIPKAAIGGDNSGLEEVRSVALSADDRSLYTTSLFDDAVARFSRNTTTGVLAYKDCVTGETQSGPGAGNSKACTVIPKASSFGGDSGLDFPQFVTVSRDGKSVYAASADDDAVAGFRRDGASGALTYRRCITGETESGPSGGTGACSAIPTDSLGGDNSGLEVLSSLALSNDARSLYAGSEGDDAIARFRREL